MLQKKAVFLPRYLFETDNPLPILFKAGNHYNRGRAILFALFLACSGMTAVQAQQPTLITHYMFNNMAINPAFAGMSGGICATGLTRQQWMGFKDPDGSATSPQTYMLTVDAPIKVLHGGVGGVIYQDQLGFFSTIAVKLGYAYRMDAGNGDLSFGLQGTLQNGTFDFSKFDLGQGAGNISGDPVLRELNGKTTDMALDLAAGAYYSVADKYYIGLSAENLLQTMSKKISYQGRRTFYLTGGYQWMLPNSPSFEILPSALLMYDGGAFQINLTALLMYNKKYYGGLAYRFQDAVSVLAGLTIKGIRVGLAYDISTSALTKYNSGSIEVMLGYCFKIDTDKYRKSYRNTRFL